MDRERGNPDPELQLSVYVCSIYWQQNAVHIAKKIPRTIYQKRKAQNFHHQTLDVLRLDLKHVL